MFKREPSVNSKIVFKITEKGFQSIGVLRYIRAVYKLEHIWDSPFEMHMGFPDLVMGI